MAQSYPTPDNQQPDKPRHTGFGPWIAGLVLILIGGYLLLRNLGILPEGLALRNWWALFILIPAFGSFSSAWQDYQANGRLTSQGRRPLIGGFILVVIVLIFLFNLNWSLLWPVLLILAGVSALLGGFLRD
ncbi:hypothetical protein EHM76_00805 [bacterium]|nr:MAG: hypothetical protein EHM76_00805 [bacterium]